ncbi:MAG: hypothetical protein R6V41_02060 [Desulfobacteraceae bacterium]
MDSHKEATELILENTPEIPLWAQLPKYPEEGMMEQFMPGMPGLSQKEGGSYIDTEKETYDEEMLAFFEDYLAVNSGDRDIENSRFTFTPETGKGFEEFLRQVTGGEKSFRALKGQVTGPITFGTSVKDQNEKAIFYDDQLRDAAIKKIAMNASWQALEFSKRGYKPIIFIDEPGLAGFGTSAFITITKEDVQQAINEVVQGVHGHGGIAGVHVCANTEWDILLQSEIDIISFDAYAFFDNFILFPDVIKEFLGRGGILAWGIVPTQNPEEIAAETVDSLMEKFEDQAARFEKIGVDRETLLNQLFVTPSCGTGSIDLDSARKVLALTKGLSERIRESR